MTWKAYLITLFWRQNRWHNHGVLVHTLKVTYHAVRLRQWRMIPACLLHDIGKPYVAHQDENDVVLGTYSFTNHEEVSYRIIRNCMLVSDYTKLLVRYHYLIRGIRKAREKGFYAKARRLQRIYDRLDNTTKLDLFMFLKIDDLGK